MHQVCQKNRMCIALPNIFKIGKIAWYLHREYRMNILVERSVESGYILGILPVSVLFA
jgi:hypothetical protein